MSDSELQRKIGDLFRNQLDTRIEAAIAQSLAMEETSAERIARLKRRRYEEDKLLMNSQRGTEEERQAARERVEAIDRQIESDLEFSRRLQSNLRQDREDAEGNENIANQANADQQREKNQALGSGRPARRGGLLLGLDLESDDGDFESEIGAPFPVNRPPNFAIRFIITGRS